MWYHGYVRIIKNSLIAMSAMEYEVTSLRPYAVAAGLLLAALAFTTHSDSPHAGGATPDGKPLCAGWVHERHTAPGPDGRVYPTWHPQVDPEYGCAFGHEHGSDPREFLGFRYSGMPAFGHVSTAADMPGELATHSGFKIYVANDDLRGKAWMVVLHQGTANPRRTRARYHAVEVWMVKRRSGRLLAHVAQMADFGAFIPNCGGAAGAMPNRLIPQVGCEGADEAWTGQLDVGGRFRATPLFAVANPATRFHPDDPDGIHPNEGACGPGDPFGWASRCKGDERSIAHPRWVLANDGPRNVFYTDAFGRLAEGPGEGVLRQFVRRSARLDEAAESGGGVAYVLRSPESGGVYVRQTTAGGGRSRGFEHPGTTLRWPN